MAGTVGPPAARPEVDPAAFVASVRRRFDDAIERVGAIDVDVRIARRVVRLSFAGDALVADLTRAFRHVTLPAVDTGVVEPDLVLRVWDSRSTGTPLPAPPWSWDRYCTRGDIDGYNTDTVSVAYAGSLNVFDRATGDACWWVPDADAVGAHEPGSPLRILLHWWLAARGLQLVHGAAVGPPTGGGILLAGAGGAGKSTTALTCLQRGWSYVADDYAVVEIGDPPTAHTLYATGKADDAARARMGGLAVTDEIPLAPRGKSILFLCPDHDDRLVDSLPIDAILLPRIGARDTTLVRPAGPLETTRALADSTLRQLPGAGGDAWRTLAALARAVPGFRLELGRDATAIPDAIEATIAGVRSPA